MNANTVSATPVATTTDNNIDPTVAFVSKKDEEKKMKKKKKKKKKKTKKTSSSAVAKETNWVFHRLVHISSGNYSKTFVDRRGNQIAVRKGVDLHSILHQILVDRIGLVTNVAATDP